MCLRNFAARSLLIAVSPLLRTGCLQRGLELGFSPFQMMLADQSCSDGPQWACWWVHFPHTCRFGGWEKLNLRSYLDKMFPWSQELGSGCKPAPIPQGFPIESSAQRHERSKATELNTKLNLFLLSQSTQKSSGSWKRHKLINHQVNQAKTQMLLSSLPLHKTVWRLFFKCVITVIENA